MFDAFALLHLLPHPWLESDDVRAAFQGRAAEIHPDRAGETADFAELTRAYETLREPAARLRHWLALAHPAVVLPAGVSPELMDWFPRVAAQVQALKQAAQRKAAATSPLARALALEALGPAEALRREIDRLQEAAFARIRELGTTQQEGEVAELVRLAGKLAFLEKWSGQLSEGVLVLRM